MLRSILDLPSVEYKNSRLLSPLSKNNIVREHVSHLILTRKPVFAGYCVTATVITGNGLWPDGYRSNWYAEEHDLCHVKVPAI